MSSDEADTKAIEDETKDNSVAEENGDSDANEAKVNNKTTPKKKGADPPKIKQPAKKRMKTEQAEKESKKIEKKAKGEEKEIEDDENEESAEENDVGNHKAVPLLDQPLEVEGSRRRKEVQRFIPPNPGEDNKEIQIPEGKGKALGEIEIIDFNIQRAKPEDLKLLHRLCFARPCKAALLKKNIKKFYGYDFEEASDEYEKRKNVIGKNKKVTVSNLKNIANILDVEKKTGTKDEILDKILSFLTCPVDTGKKLPGVGRSKRSGASAKNYDEGDEKFSSRKKSKAKKKSEESEESEKEKSDDDEDSEEKEEEKPKKNEKNKNNTEANEESDVNDEDEEEEEEEKPKKGAKKGGKKAAEKKAPPKKRAAAKKVVEKSESEKDEDSDEDEPLSKKSKGPPTDEEIKTYVKSLLDGANLELITMKKVCHDVYAHYPDFDLGHKKDFIKTTVKSLISS